MKHTAYTNVALYARCTVELLQRKYCMWTLYSVPNVVYVRWHNYSYQVNLGKDERGCQRYCVISGFENRFEKNNTVVDKRYSDIGEAFTRLHGCRQGSI